MICAFRCKALRFEKNGTQSVDRVVFIHKNNVKHIDYDNNGKMTIEYIDNSSKYYANYENKESVKQLYNKIIYAIEKDTVMYEFLHGS